MKRQCLALLESWLPLFEEVGVGSLCLGARMKSELLHPQRLLSERFPDRDPGRRRPGSQSLPCRDRHARGWGPPRPDISLLSTVPGTAGDGFDSNPYSPCSLLHLKIRFPAFIRFTPFRYCIKEPLFSDLEK